MRRELADAYLDDPFAEFTTYLIAFRHPQRIHQLHKIFRVVCLEPQVLKRSAVDVDTWSPCANRHLHETRQNVVCCEGRKGDLGRNRVLNRDL